MPDQKSATIMLFSTDMDKVLTAFMIATGFAAMGVNVTLWFTIWGANCLKKRRGLFHSWFGNSKKPEGGSYRRLESDTILQNLIEMVNRGGPRHLPLSRLHLFGLGPIIFNYILKRKNIPTVEEFILSAEKLGIHFTICQACADALALDTDDLIVKNVDVKGVSQYMKDCMDAHYNIFI